MIFKKSISDEIQELAKSILNAEWKRRISTLEIESIGILDGEEIIFEYLEHNEYGCAFDHLTYLVSETETKVTIEQAEKIEQLNKILKS